MKIPMWRAERRVLIRAPLAQFNDPSGPEQISRLVPSHTALEGVLRSKLGVLEVAYDIQRVSFLRRPYRITMTVREASNLTISSTKSGVKTELRNRGFLVDVAMVVEFSIRYSGTGDHFEKKGDGSYNAGATLNKLAGMFDDRLKNGNNWQQPYLGTRECSAKVSAFDGEVVPAPFDADEGICFFGMDYATRTPYLHPMAVRGGVIEYPTWDVVKQRGIRGRQAA